MEKTVKSQYLETDKYSDGQINSHKANLEGNDYLTDYSSIHTVDELPDWYNDTPMELYLQDWIMTNELNEDGGATWYSLDSKDGVTQAFYTPREKFKQMKL